jgi:hypothetical protein
MLFFFILEKAGCFSGKRFFLGCGGCTLFDQKALQDLIEFSGNFHHRRMAAFVNKMQLAMRNKSLKFLAYKRRSNGVVIAPDKAGGLFYLI